MIAIGKTYMLDKTHVVHVQDVDYLRLLAMCGVADPNGIVWTTEWVSFDRLYNNTDYASCVT